MAKSENISVMISFPPKLMPYVHQLMQTGAYGEEYPDVIAALATQKLREMMREDEVIKLESKSEGNCQIGK